MTAAAARLRARPQLRHAWQPQTSGASKAQLLYTSPSQTPQRRLRTRRCNGTAVGGTLFLPRPAGAVIANLAGELAYIAQGQYSHRPGENRGPLHLQGPEGHRRRSGPTASTTGATPVASLIASYSSTVEEKKGLDNAGLGRELVSGVYRFSFTTTDHATPGKDK